MAPQVAHSRSVAWAVRHALVLSTATPRHALCTSTGTHKGRIVWNERKAGPGRVAHSLGVHLLHARRHEPRKPEIDEHCTLHPAARHTRPPAAAAPAAAATAGDPVTAAAATHAPRTSPCSATEAAAPAAHPGSLKLQHHVLRVHEHVSTCRGPPGVRLVPPLHPGMRQGRGLHRL